MTDSIKGLHRIFITEDEALLSDDEMLLQGNHDGVYPIRLLMRAHDF
ncbi:hypothetical protein [Leclercia sp.]